MMNENDQQQLTISVVVPAYNNAAHIRRSIDSVLAQSRAADEIIVVDDGSTDGTEEILKSYGQQIRTLEQANAGASAARNTGIRAAQCNWIALLDGDDEWLPDKLQRQTDLLKRNPHLRWTTGNYIECLCEENRRAARYRPQECRRSLQGNDYFSSYFQAIQQCRWGCTDCMLIHKDVFSDVGLFCTDLPKANDLDMWLRIAYRFPQVGFSCEPLAIYHLSTVNSIVKKYRKTDVYTGFMQRHFQIAETEGKLADFIPAAGAMMRLWIRGLLFEGRKDEIRSLLFRFPQSFTPAYQVIVKCLTVFPRLTAAGLHEVSKISRALRLRRRVTRRPHKP